MGRQIALVFLGQPRTEAAAHAHEPGNRMTVPLLVLAFFAIILGFFNIPENFPLIGHGWLHHFAGEVHEASEVLNLEALPFNWLVAGVSTVIALAGLFSGLGLYRHQKAGEEDPLARILGPIFTLLKNKYYVDELYQATFINGAVYLAKLAASFDYDWVINPLVDLVGNTGRWLGDFSAKFDEVVVDGIGVLGTANLFKWLGKELRITQTGQAQNYLLGIALASLAVIGMYFALA
jgi:NADH-quinone oxidoreductase subunit L